jgi:Tfp pilus assembly protein PilZ
VLSLNIRERAALYAAYMPFLKGGGIFIPTSRQYQLGEEVFMLLSLMDDPNRIAVQGKVVWITPEGVQGQPDAGDRRSVHAGRNRRHRALDHRADPGRDAGIGPPDPYDVGAAPPSWRPRRPRPAAASLHGICAASGVSRNHRCTSTLIAISIFRSSPPKCRRCSRPWPRRASRTHSASA